ncbi:MAG TPA: hypothetical protein VFO53_07990 [Casimicrobiaceae bacterium]|nr:hypothetical protein [Casimicrobiaceae bacterium]
MLRMLRPAPVVFVERRLDETFDVIGFGSGDLSDLLQTLLGVAADLLDLIAHLLGEADRLLLGEAAHLPLHFDDSLARLSRRIEHLFGAGREEASRAIVANVEQR